MSLYRAHYFLANVLYNITIKEMNEESKWRYEDEA